MRVVFLGADVPLEEIIFTAKRQAAHGVVLSVAKGYRGDLHAHLEQLACLKATRLAVGGQGSIGVRSDQVLSSLFDLFNWASELREKAARTRARSKK